MACQLGKGIYGRFVFSMFWAKDIVLLQLAYQSCGSPSSQTTCKCSLLVKLGDNYLGGLDPCLALGRAT